MTLQRLITRPKIDWASELAKAVAEEETAYELADRLGTAFRTVVKYANEHEITLISAQEREDRKRRTLLEKAKADDLTLAAFAKEHGIAYGTAKSWVDSTGIVLRVGKSMPLGQSRGKGTRVRATDEEWRESIEKCLKEGLTRLEISERLSVTSTTLGRHAKRLGIELPNGRSGPKKAA